MGKWPEKSAPLPYSSILCKTIDIVFPPSTIRPLVTVSLRSRIIQDVSFARQHCASSRRILRFTNIHARATELTVQSERAFQKQPHIFLNSKTKTKSARPGKGGRRWYKDVGLGFRTPKTAIEGSYIGTCEEMIEIGRIRNGQNGKDWNTRKETKSATAGQRDENEMDTTYTPCMELEFADFGVI